MLENDSWVAPSAAELRGLVERDFKISFQNLSRTRAVRYWMVLKDWCINCAAFESALLWEEVGARGMAHLGVLKALENSGIVVDMIAGTSAGAMTGYFMRRVWTSIT